jgi:hypothetical protein
MAFHNDPIYDTDSSDENDSDWDDELAEDDDSLTRRTHTLVVCELYNDLLHGETHANGHFLVYETFQQLDDRRLKQTTDLISKSNRKLVRTNSPKLRHKLIRNYARITETNAFNTPQIAICCRLPSGEMVAILKTVYLRIFQRKWKKYYKKLMDNLRMRMTLAHINASRLSWPIRFR